MGAVGCGGKWEPEERAEYLWCSPCSAGEIVLGDNDRHLDLRVSLLVERGGRDGREKTLHVSSASMSSIHTEYDYRGKGQCVTLSVPDNTYFLFPLEEGFNATEIQFAVEEFFERSHS